MNKIIFIPGNKIYLRPLEVEDINNGYQKWINDEEITKYLETGLIPQNKEELKNFITNKAANRINFAICLTVNDKHIGNCALTCIDWINQVCEIGIMMGDKEQWGKNIAIEAYSILINYAFNKLRMRKIVAGVVMENQGIIITLQKLGFQKEGKLRKQGFYNGKYQDILRFGLFKEEFITFNYEN